MLALGGSLTAHDPAYVALAGALDAPLVTFDRRLAGRPVTGRRSSTSPGDAGHGDG